MSDTPLNIAVDIDGVLLDFIDGFIPVVKERLGVTLRYDSIVTHDLDLLLGISRDELWELVNETLATRWFPMIPGAREGMEALGRHHIDIVTSRPEQHRERTKRNLETYGLSFRDIHFRNYLRKFTETDGTQVLVEDSLEEALLASQFVPHVLLFRQPWNAHTYNAKHLVTPVMDWEEVVRVVKEIEDGRDED
jgi:uncharacterized HAD superfamily protein